uniref:Uncharacterized protein n=1 Tax=Utricularia reniformis TaxID=192314 RepID=A0A1Y0B0R5_9LAMI|nr:hypothetical protein AEK19_MT0749 [Utricularia reniformis]ART30993.1 hypothetical protein AEK19_MT0749 [Utricularia reniformis]
MLFSTLQGILLPSLFGALYLSSKMSRLDISRIE